MSIKWVGTISLVGLFAVFVVLPTALVCGPSLQLLAAFILGVLVSYFLFAATEHHEYVQPTTDDHLVAAGDLDPTLRRRGTMKRNKAINSALLAIAAWVPYVIVLLSLGWTGWWWILAIIFFLISLVIVLDLAGPILWEA